MKFYGFANAALYICFWVQEYYRSRGAMNIIYSAPASSRIFPVVKCRIFFRGIEVFFTKIWILQLFLLSCLLLRLLVCWITCSNKFSCITFFFSRNQSSDQSFTVISKSHFIKFNRERASMNYLFSELYLNGHARINLPKPSHTENNDTFTTKLSQASKI